MFHGVSEFFGIIGGICILFAVFYGIDTLFGWTILNDFTYGGGWKFALFTYALMGYISMSGKIDDMKAILDRVEEERLENETSSYFSPED